MTTIQKIKAQQLAKFSQVLLIREDGTVLESCNSIFSLEYFEGRPANKWFPFIESIFTTLITLKVDEPEIRFTKIEQPFSVLGGVYDFTFSKVKVEGNELILWVIYDYTTLYEDLAQFQQKRNELEIHRQRVEQNMANLKHQKDVLLKRNAQLEATQILQNNYYTKVKNDLEMPASVIDNLTLILADILNGEEVKQYVDTLKVSKDYLSVIIDDLDNISELKIAKVAAKKEAFNLTDLLNPIFAKFQNIAQNIKIDYLIHPTVPKQLEGDALRLKQVIYNLLINAIKYLEEGSRLMLNITLGKKTKAAQYVSFEVKDTSLNLISGERLQKLILDYKNNTNSIPTEYADLVLRLTIIKKIIELQGGILSFSTIEHRPSTINFQIPFER